MPRALHTGICGVDLDGTVKHVTDADVTQNYFLDVNNHQNLHFSKGFSPTWAVFSLGSHFCIVALYSDRLIYYIFTSHFFFPHTASTVTRSRFTLIFSNG